MFDKSLSREWVRAAQGFLAKEPRKYGTEPSEDVYLNFIDGKISEKFDNFNIDIKSGNFQDSKVQTIIGGILDRAIQAEADNTSPLHTNAALKVATSLKATLGFCS